MNKYLVKQLALHKSMSYQDVVKMCYQACFGMEHLVNDKMKQYLFDEFQIAQENDILFEEISDDYVRVNLACWQKCGFSKEKLWDIFINSKDCVKQNDFKKLMEEYLETLSFFWNENEMKEMKLFLSDYYSNGINPIHHSKIYTDNEHPHYRLVKKELINEEYLNV